MKLFTPEKENYARWRYQTLQVGNRATEVVLYQIWCASEVSTGLNSAFYYTSVYNRNSTFFHWNYQILHKKLKFIHSQYHGCMLKIEIKRAIFSQKCSEVR